jgi:glycerophosphoryl diester phosphodiesterase
MLFFLLVGLIIAIACSFLCKLPRGILSDRFVGMIVGHRGCRWISTEPSSTSQIIPENSMASFKRAVEGGCTAVELDCRLTVDGEIVVFHDDIISRMCTVDNVNGKLFISDLTLAEVKKLRYKNWNSDDTIPTLEEVLQWARINGIKVFVELKSLTFDESKLLAKKSTDIFKKLEAWEYACVIAFHPVAVYYTRFYAPKIETCILYCEDFFTWGVVNKAERQYWWAPLVGIMDFFLIRISYSLVPWITGCTMVGPDIRVLTKRDIAYFEEQKLGIYCWVANTVSDMDFFLNYKCSVGTDFVFPKVVDKNLIQHEIHSKNMSEYNSTSKEYYVQTVN